MKTRIISLSAIVAAFMIVACKPQQQAAPAAESLPVVADLVLRGGPVYTVDANRSWAQAVAISDGYIIFVGTDGEVEQYIGAGTRIVDLEGRMAMPSFQDSHIHPIWGGIEALTVDLADMDSLDRYVATIREYAKSNPDEAWILGGGWSMSVFGPGALASRLLIDEVVSDRPVYLTSSDGHTGWANSKALELSGIDDATPDPFGGRIDRDPDSGAAIGSLQESAMDLVAEHIPPKSLEDNTAGLKYAINMLNNYGITAIQDASHQYAGSAELEAFRALDERGELSLRVVVSLWWDRNKGQEQIDGFKQQREEFTVGNVSASTVKIMQDGVMENFTAAVLEPYIGQGGAKGMPMVEPEALKTAVAALDAEDFQVHFHAIGDAAVRQCLDAVEVARRQNGNRGNRHHISHLELIDPSDIPRFRRLNVVANFQPLWATDDEYITDLTLPYLSKARSRWLYPIASVHQSGAMIAFGSDWSVSTANPLDQIETAITRMGSQGQTNTPFLSEEAIDLPTALAAFTINAAFVNDIEDVSGSVEVGKAADLIVLDRNLFEIPHSEISEAKVLLTLLNGRPVHGDPTQL